MTLASGQQGETLDLILGSLALDADQRQKTQILEMLALLQRWNATYNLTAVRDPAAMLVQHVADCLAVIRPLADRIEKVKPARLLDVGSGAGFPGAVIAVMLPWVQVTCIDSVGKKAAFVRQLASALDLPNLHSEHGRVEELRAASFDVITSRAFSTLKLFTELTARLLASKGVWMAMKGKVPADDIASLLASGLRVDVEQLTVPRLAAERCLVWLHPARSEPSLPR